MKKFKSLIDHRLIVEYSQFFAHMLHNICLDILDTTPFIVHIYAITFKVSTSLSNRFLLVTLGP